MFGSLGLPEIAILAFVSVPMWAAISFLCWFVRAYRISFQLSHTKPKSSSAELIAMWLFPFLNLYFPYQTAKEIWVRSNDAAVQAGAECQGKPEDGVLKSWWILVVTMAIVFVALIGVGLGGSEALRRLGMFFLLSVIGTEVATISVISKIETMQSIALRASKRGQSQA